MSSFTLNSRRNRTTGKYSSATVTGNYLRYSGTEWDEKPLGALINVAEVKKRLTDTIGSPGFRRLNASGVVMRNLGAHQNFEKVSIDEALASTRFLFDFIERWLSLNYPRLSEEA